MRLSDIQHDYVRKLANINLGPIATLAINAGGAATVKTTGALNYSVGGLLKTKAALAAQALAADATIQQRLTGQAGFYTQPANTTAYLLLGVAADGTVKCFQGRYSAIPYTPYISPKGDGDIPSDIGDYVPFGYIKVVTAATTFLPGTDALDKAAVTFTFGELTHVPATNP